MFSCLTALVAGFVLGLAGGALGGLGDEDEAAFGDGFVAGLADAELVGFAGHAGEGVVDGLHRGGAGAVAVGGDDLVHLRQRGLVLVGFADGVEALHGDRDVALGDELGAAGEQGGAQLLEVVAGHGPAIVA